MSICLTDPSVWSAGAAVLTAIFTGLLYWYTLRLWRTTKAALDLAQNEFIAAHRPRLAVRNIVLKRPPNYHAYFKFDSEPRGQFYVENKGGSDAIIKDSYCSGHCTDGELPMERPYEGAPGNAAVSCSALKPGLSVPGLFNVTPWSPSHVAELNQGRGGWKFFLYGWIEYEDRMGTNYRTAFCRRWDATTNRFVPVNDPDYEHG